MNKLKVLGILCELQKECAPIEISIGTITNSNMVDHDAIVIKEAPACVTERLIKEGYSLSIRSFGTVEVDYYGDEEDKK